MPHTIRLVIFDCDLTLWNHRDASALQRPLALVSPDSIRDQAGTLITLYPQVRAVLAALQQRGLLLSVCSWNYEQPASEMLDLYGISHYFRHGKIEPHPDKAGMIARMLAEFRADGVELTNDQVVFTDDRTLHSAEINTRLPGLHVVQMWVDVPDHEGLLAWVEERHANEHDVGTA